MHLFQNLPQCRLADGMMQRRVQQLRAGGSYRDVGGERTSLPALVGGWCPSPLPQASDGPQEELFPTPLGPTISKHAQGEMHRQMLY